LLPQQLWRRQLSDSSVYSWLAIPIPHLTDNSRPRKTNRNWLTVLYMKIRLRCTKLYFDWQTITPTDLEAPDLLLKSSNKPLKNLMIFNNIAGGGDFGISIA
jgi:hypothetical protein